MCKNKKKSKVRKSTRVQEMLQDAGEGVKLDAYACRILAEPEIFARVAKYFVPELSELSIEEILAAEVGVIGAGPREEEGTILDISEPFQPNSTVIDKSADYGTTAFDVSGRFRLPPNKQRIPGIILNLEPQARESPADQVHARAQCYTARNIVMQQQHEFDPPHYEKIWSVYSIWIILHPPKYAENTMAWSIQGDRPETMVDRIADAAEQVYQECQDKPRDEEHRLTMEAIRNPSKVLGTERIEAKNSARSLGNILFVRLGNPDMAPNAALKFLDTIFSEDLSPDRKCSILHKEFGVPISKKLRKDMDQMGAVSAAIEGRVTERVTKEVTYADAVKWARIGLKWGQSRKQIFRAMRDGWPELSVEDAEEAIEEARKSLKKKKKKAK